MIQLRTDTLASRCKWLGLAIAGLWLPTSAVALHFYGMAGVEATTISAVCCLLAGCLTFWTVSRESKSRVQAFAVLIGTLIRGAFALVAAGIMQFGLELPLENYLIWLALFYLASLAAETVLLVRFR